MTVSEVDTKPLLEVRGLRCTSRGLRFDDGRRAGQARMTRLRRRPALTGRAAEFRLGAFAPAGRDTLVLLFDRYPGPVMPPPRSRSSRTATGGSSVLRCSR
jgi:hypothetical protein